MRYTTKILFFIVFVLLQTPGFGQNAADIIREVMRNIEAGDYTPVDQRPLYTQENLNTTIDVIQPYLNDSLVVVKAKAYTILKRAGLASDNRSVRSEIVEQMASGLNDSEKVVQRQLLGQLTEFDKSDFSTRSLDILNNLVTNPGSYYDQVVLLAGFLELTNQANYLNGLLQQDSVLSRRDQWAIRLALARMGDAEQLSIVMATVRRMPINDEVLYEVYPDLIYTRQKSAFDFLINVLQDDTALCQSADPEISKQILCGYRIMEMLAPVLQDFPLPLDDSGDLLSEDYRTALSTIREWLAVQGSNYNIIIEKY